jgi:molybdopterin-guanine dinucleotide biosynthesis protein A
MSRKTHSLPTEAFMGRNSTGLVLAGGKSSRFGSDKALALLDGRSLLERATGVLRPWTLEIAISASAESPAGAEARRLGFSVLPDRPGLVRGPLTGILAGLEWSARRDAKWMISLPCDVISLPDDAFPRLLAAAGANNGAYAVTTQGPQSLCAVWPVEAKNVLEAVLNCGTHPPVRVIANLMGASPVYFDQDGIFLNVNTKDDLAAAEKAPSS